MNSRDRVFAALRREVPDRVPMLEFSIDGKVISAICPDCDYFDFVERYDLDAVRVGQQYADFKDGCRVIDAGKKIIVDKWGITRQYSGEILWFAVDAPIKSEEDLESFVPPDPAADGVLGRLPEVVRRFKGKKAIVYALNDSFLIPSELRGLEDLFMDYLENPDFARRITDMCVAYSVVEVRRAIEAGAEIIMLRDDYAYKNGLMMSPAHFDEFILPGLSRIVRAIKEAGAFAVKHCDGNIWSILDKIVATGVDAINPLEPVAGMDIAEVKRKYGDRVCLIGNIDCGEDDQRKPLMIPITTLPSATVYLYTKNSDFPGRCIVALDTHETELFNLDKKKRQEFIESVNRVAKAVSNTAGADKINYAIYGDTANHLHFHIVPTIRTFRLGNPRPA